MASRVNIITTGIKNQEAKNDQINAGAGDQGKTLKIKAQAGSKYQLQDMQSPKLVGPQSLKLKRNGNDLEVTLENGQKPDVVIENYYTEITSPNEGLMGQNSSGVMQSYAPVEASGVSSTLKAPANQVVTATLSGPAVEASAGALLPAAAGPSMASIVGAAAGVAAVAGGVGGSSSKDNSPPVITSGDSATVAENAPTGTVVYTAAATDADAGTTLVYSLSGTDAALFNIDASTGAVTLKAAANYESKSSYSINVVASDGTASVSKAVKVNVSNVEEEATGKLAVTGTAEEGGTLTANLSDASDADGTIATTTYRWQENISGTWTDISGANAAALSIPADQSYVGKQVRVVATTTDALGGTTEFMGESKTIANVDDEATGTLGVTGTAEEGGKLTASLSDASDADGTIATTTYRWQENISGTWTDITGANAAALSIPADQSYVGKQVRVVATTTDALGGTTEFMGESKTIANVDDEATGTLGVTGTAEEGGKLTASLSDASDADGTIATTTYRWQENISGTWTDISGANAAALSIPADQSYVGKQVRVVATTTDALGGTTEFMGESKTIANVDDEATGTLGVTGTAEEGGKLTASLSDASDADGTIATTTYRWQENISGTWTDISGANAAALSIPADQSYVGKQVRVVATTTDALGGTTEFMGESKTIANVDDAATGTLTVEGADADGGKLIANLSAVSDADGDTNTTYQWQVKNNDTWADISEATTATLSLAPSTERTYLGKQVRVVATTTDVLRGTTTFESLSQTSNKASITGTNEGELDEDSLVVLQVGRFRITDADAGEAVFRKPDGAVDVDGNENQYKLTTDYGTFTFTYQGTNPGAWAYQINKASPKVQALAQGTYHTDEIDVVSVDGTAKATVKIKINGANDDADEMAGDFSGKVTENSATNTATGFITVTDDDIGENKVKEERQTGDFGDFEINADGRWTYTLDNDNADIQKLKAGETKTDTFLVRSFDEAVEKSVTVTITGTNDAPVFTSADTDTVYENDPTSVVYEAKADDAEGATLTYSLGTTGDNTLFNIDGSTGKVTLKESANFEEKSEYDIEVIATESTGTTPLSTSKAVKVTVNNVNEVPTFSAATATVDMPENTDIGTLVYTAVAGDVDAGTKLVYSLEGDDQEMFTIDSTSGEVKLNTQANFEATKNIYNITVKASDGTGPTALSATQAVTIKVTNVNEAPTITSSNTGSVAENAATGAVVYTVKAEDVDGGNFTYSLEGKDVGMFTIDSVSGEVKLKTEDNPAVDFESTKKSYDITVKATDGTGQTALSATKAVTIDVTNVNEAPTFAAATATVNLAENTATSTVVYDAAATDPEGDALIYSLGTTGDHSLFEIDEETGEVKLIAPANFESDKKSYTITVNASDNSTLPVATQTVTINVTNVNEAPTFADATPTASKVVTKQQATEVFRSVADDVDADTTLTYTLGGDDEGLFDINASTGVVTTKAAKTYEVKDYSISVTASDGSFSATQTVKVKVSGLNNAPVITSADTGSVAENTETSPVVYTAVATDEDAGTTPTYSLGTTGDNLLFNIDPNTGEVKLNAKANYEAKREYNIEVIAEDDFASVSKAVKVNVTNVDEAPVFSSGLTATANVVENTPISTVVYQAVATDPEGAVLTYTLGGTDRDKFDISSTGAVTLKDFANYEAKSSYAINVIATDGTNHSTTQNVQVNVTNVNEAPTFEAPSQTVTIAESWDINTAVFTAVATDPEGLAPKYTLSGTDKEAFTIDESTGAVKLKSSANFEAKTSYSINVIASDGTGTNALSATQAVTINVANVNEAPVFTSGDTGTVAENAANGTVVYTAVAGDVDAGTTLVYSLDGTDKDMFTIESDTGKVKLKTEDNPAVDFESTKKSYDIIVKASDAKDLNAPSKTQSVTINVTNVNEAPVATFNTAQAFTEDTGVKTGQLTATDVDTAQANLRYTLNTPIAGVTLAANGAWSFDTTHPSYQSLGSSTPKAITVNYTVSDGTLSDNTGSFVINLTGKDDPATITGTRTGLVKNVVSTNVATGNLDVSDVDSGEAVFSGTGITTSQVSNGQFSFDNASGSWGYSLTSAVNNTQADARIVDQKLTVTSKDSSDTEDVNVGIYVAGTNSTNLVLDGAASLDLSALRALDSTIKVDKVDMSSTDANSLKLDAASVLDMNTNANERLVVDGGTGDTVDLVGTWAKAAAPQTANAKTYDVYSLDGAEVWIQNTVTNVI